MTKETLIGASVAIRNTKIAASTDASGQVTLFDIPRGKQVVVCSYIGYPKKCWSLIFPWQMLAKYIRLIFCLMIAML
ncbi:MAG: carboxypeptidase-like regulatory domain-containing protein [Pedobacter sp.]|nr:MAG: carboxypeptidase-like regulatory domain-containing protein [Pedobacter sp.]